MGYIRTLWLLFQYINNEAVHLPQDNPFHISGVSPNGSAGGRIGKGLPGQKD